jgi:Condensation domain
VMSASTPMPTLSYQEGRLLMDERCRRLSVPSVRTIAQAYRVTGALDLRAFDRALTLLAERHEALRAAFPGGAHEQVVAPAGEVRAVLADVSGHADPRAAAIERVRLAAARPLPAQEPERLRATVVRVAEEDHFVVVVVDHLVVDGWARGLLLTELSELYTALAAGRAPRLREVTYRYSDHVREQRALLTGPEGERLTRFWAGRLAGSGAIPRLPVPKLPPGRPAEGGCATRRLPAELVERIRRFTAQERVTPFMLVLCALQVALGRRTGRADQAVAVNVYNRETADREHLVAPLAELLVVRTDLTGAPTFRDALRRVRTSSLDAQDHGAMPFAELVKAFNPDEYADPDAPIGVVLNMLYAEVHGGGLDLAPAATEPFPLSDEGFRPRSELMVVADVGHDELDLTAVYQADRLPAEFVAGLLDEMVELLEAAPENPALDVSRELGRV